MNGWVGLLPLAWLCGAPGGDGLEWVRAATPPSSAVVAGEEPAAKVILCRGYLADGVHPGRFDDGACLVPQKGQVERVRDFEFAAGGAVRWGRPEEDEAVVVGRQNGRRDLFACRRVERGRVQVGKAYLDGPHAGSCYAGADGKEVEIRSGYEILLKRRNRQAR